MLDRSHVILQLSFQPCDRLDKVYTLIGFAGIVYNVFEAVDVITLIKGGTYDGLGLSVGEALKKRSPVCTFLVYLLPYIYISYSSSGLSIYICTYLYTHNVYI